MNLTDVFIRRPVLALVVNLVIVIAGLQAIRNLNVHHYPRSENAVVTITTAYVGAGADLVRGFVTTPLERAIAGHFPLTLVSGAGAAARDSIGLVLVGGMAIGTLFTLFVIPSIYMLIARDQGGTATPEGI